MNFNQLSTREKIETLRKLQIDFHNAHRELKSVINDLNAKSGHTVGYSLGALEADTNQHIVFLLRQFGEECLSEGK